MTGRGELRLRLAVGIGGLVLLVALWAGGLLPGGAGKFELLALAGLFFGATAVHAAVALRKDRGPER